MTKRKSTKRKNPNLYIAKATDIRPAPREEIVKIVKDVLKEKQYKMARKHVKKISIIKSQTRTRGVTVGTWFGAKEAIKIYDHTGIPQEEYNEVIRHELAHAEFHYLKKYNSEAYARFVLAAMNHGPISKYIKDHTRYFLKYRNKDLTSLYADEMHSELATILQGLTRTVVKPSEKLIQAYKELHFLV